VQLPGYRELAVLVQPYGKPATGYTVNAVAADPKLVTVQGAPITIAELSGYITVPVEITGANADVVERVPLKLPENVSVLGTQSVEAQVSIVPVIGTQTLRRRPVIQGLGAGLGYTLTLDAVSVFASGPLPKLLALKEDSVPVILDLAGLGPGVHAVEPKIPTPDDVKVEGLSPENIEITIWALPTPTVTPAPTATPASTRRK
jgi:YbbR domain-containing protein